jgi:hypothetical protein
MQATTKEPIALRWRMSLRGSALLALIGSVVIAVQSPQAQQVDGAADGNQVAQTQNPVKKKPSAANSFNRLMKNPASRANASPAEDGIHDPANPGTHTLQWPSEAFQDLPKAGRS